MARFHVVSNLGGAFFDRKGVKNNPFTATLTLNSGDDVYLALNTDNRLTCNSSCSNFKLALIFSRKTGFETCKLKKQNVVRSLLCENILN